MLWTRRIRRLIERFADKLLDHFLELLVLALLGAFGSVGGWLAKEFAHRNVLIATFIVIGTVGLVGLLIAAVDLVVGLRRRAEYLEAQKELVYNALESIQQALGMEEEWDLDGLVERGVLEPARGLLMGTRMEDVRLAVLTPDDERPHEWTMRWAAGHRPESVQRYRRPIDLTLAGRAFRNGETVVIPDVTGEAGFVPNPKATRDFRSLVAHPVQINDEPVGALSVVSTETAAFDTIDVSFIRVVAAVIDVLLAAEHDAWMLVQAARAPDEDEQDPPGGG